MATTTQGDARDPAFLDAHFRALSAVFDRYHDARVEGLDRVPPGPALLVGNHHGGTTNSDLFALMFAWWRHHGVDDPTYGLAHDMLFHAPWLRTVAARAGAVRASPDVASALLARGARVLVYPGGDLDALKPWSRRNEVVFGERAGFVRLALRSRAPVVPVVSAGGHEGFRVLPGGAAIARALGLGRLRVEAMPLALSLPWGLAPAPMPYLPLPMHLRLRVLDPITWPDLSPDAADDPAVVRRCRDEVRATMQRALDAMVREGPVGRMRAGTFARRLLAR